MYLTSIFSLLLLAASSSALVFDTPTYWNSARPVTATWKPKAGDPGVFSLELINTVFHDSFAIANNVATESSSITVTLPVVPARDGYTLNAVALNNISMIYASSGTFTIGDGDAPPTSSTTGKSSTTSKASSTKTSGFSSSTSSRAASTTTASTTAGFGITVAANSTTLSSTASDTSSLSQASLPTGSGGAISRASASPLALLFALFVAAIYLS